MRMMLALCSLLLSFTAMAGVEGYWKTIDDETGKPRSIVHITVVDGKLQGRIVQLFRQPGEAKDPDCTECQDDLHMKKIVGMEIVSGLKGEGDDWNGGSIMDPGKGKTYGCNMQLQDEGKKLKVRGYLGIAMLGRTQYWYPASKPDLSIRTYLLNTAGDPMPLVYADGREATEAEIKAHLGQ